MPRNLCITMRVLVLLLASGDISDAFSVSSKFHRNIWVARGTGDIYRGRIGSDLFVSDTSFFEKESLNDDCLEEDQNEYISQGRSAKINAPAILLVGCLIATLALPSLATLAPPSFNHMVLSDIQLLKETVVRIPTDVWHSYSAVLKSNPVQTKAVTSATVYTIGDFIAQYCEGSSLDELDLARVGRSLIAGLLGHGPLSHLWYDWSESVFQNVLHLHNDIFGTIAKVVIDQATWGPFWNNTYILLLGLMKLESIETIWGEMRSTTIPLIVSGLKFWPLAHCVTYGLVPVENRLLWVDIVEIFWVTILATTAASASNEKKEDK